jgi:hypothetical protein
MMEINYDEDLGLEKIEKTNESGQVITQLNNFPNGYYTIESKFDGDDGYSEASVEDFKFQVINGYYTRFVITLYDLNDEILERYCNAYNIEDGIITEKYIIDMNTGDTVSGISFSGKYYDGNKIGILLQYNETGLYSDGWNNKLVLNDVNLNIDGIDYDLSNNTTEEFIYNINQKEVKEYAYDFSLSFKETNNMESSFINFNYLQEKNDIKIYDSNGTEIVSSKNYTSYIDEYKTEKLTVKTVDGFIVPQLLYDINKSIFGENFNFTDNNGNISVDNLIKDDDFVEWNDNTVNPFTNNLVVCKNNCELVWKIKHNEDYIIQVGQKLNIEVKSNSQKWKFTYNNKTLEGETKYNLNSNYLLSIGKVTGGNGIYRVMIDNNLICGFEGNYFNTTNDTITISKDRNIVDKVKIAIGNTIAHESSVPITINNDNNINNKSITLNIKLQELDSTDEIDYLVDGYNKKKVINNYSTISITKGDVNGIVFNNKNQTLTSSTNLIDLKVNKYNSNDVFDVLFYRKNNHSIIKLLNINRNIYPMNWKLVDVNDNNNDYNIEFNLSINEIQLNSLEENQSAITNGLNFVCSGDIGISNIPVTLVQIFNGVTSNVQTVNSGDDGTVSYSLNRKLNNNDDIYNYQYKISITKANLTDFGFEKTESEIQNLLINKYVPPPTPEEQETGIIVSKHISKIEVFGNDVNSNYYVYVYDDYNVSMTLTIGNKSYTVENGTLLNGKYRYYFELGKLDYGDKTITVKSTEEMIGRNTILSETQTRNFTVNKLTPTLNINSVTKNNNNISYTYDNITMNINEKLYYDDNIVIKGTSNAKSGTNVYLNQQSVGTVNSNGEFTVTVPVNSNNLTFEIMIDSNDLTPQKSLSCSLSNVVKIGTTITLTGSNTYWGQKTNVTAKIVDENNIAMNGVTLTLNGTNSTTDSQGTATFTITMGDKADVTTSYKCIYAGNDKYKDSEKSISLTTQKRPVTITTKHPTGTSSSNPVYKSWELKYVVKDSVDGSTVISSPTVAIYVNGNKQTTSYTSSTGTIKCSMPNLGASDGKTTKVKCSFSHSNYVSKTTSEQNVYYISYKTFLRVPTHFANNQSLTGGRCMWSDKDGNRTNAEMAKENLKYGSGNSSYLICSNKDYPFYSNDGSVESPDRRKPVQLNMSSWTTATSLPSSVKSYNAYVYLRERNPSYKYNGKSYGSRVGKPSLKMTFASGTKTVSSTSVSTDTMTDVINGTDISTVTWSNLRSSMSATLNHAINAGSKKGILYLSILCIRIIYIPNQSGY